MANPPKQRDIDAPAVLLSAQSLATLGGLIIGTIGLLLSIFSLFLQYSKTKALNVVVSDVGSTKSDVNLAITFSNPGDTTEVVTDTSLTVYKTDGRSVFYKTSLDPCYVPIVVPPNGVSTKFFKINIPQFARPVRSTGNLTQELELQVYVLSNRASPLRTTIPLGTIEREQRFGHIISASIITRAQRIRVTGSIGSSDFIELRSKPRPSTCNVQSNSPQV